MDLPIPISRYFEAETIQDVEAVAEVFAMDALVKDESATHEGRTEIGAWLVAAKRKYRHVAVPLDWIETDGTVSVRARVSGQFPNSPATLQFHFTLSNDRITGLEID